MRFCPNCGNPLGGSPRYCAGCATQVGAGNEPGESPWPLSAPPWQVSPQTWTASDPPWTASDPPWAGRDHPAAGQAVITGNPGASPPSARPGRWPRLSPRHWPRLSPRRWPRLSPRHWPWPPAGRRTWLHAGHGMTITAMVTTVALLATGGIAAWQVGQLRSRVPVTNTSLALRGTGADRTPGSGRTSRALSSPATGSPAKGSPAAGGAVTVAPAAAVQPHVHRVVMLLDSYFSAINRHDFQAYSSLFIPAIRVGLHNFGTAYQSTRDSRARLTGLSVTGPQGLAATVTFVSHQNPAESPDRAACDRWHITLFLKRGGTSYHIRRHQPGFPADTVRACR